MTDEYQAGETIHGRVRSLWTGALGQVAAHRPDGSIELLMDSGETLLVTPDEENLADWEWLGDEEVF